MANFQYVSDIKKEGGVPDVSTDVIRNRVDAWVSRYNPRLQGEVDTRNPDLERNSRGLTLYEQRIEESFKKEMSLIVFQFSEKDSTLRSAFETNKAAWSVEMSAYENAMGATKPPPVTDDQPYAGFGLSLFTLKIIFVIAFIALTVLDYYFLFTFIDLKGLRVFTSSALSATMLFGAYYAGKLFKENAVQKWMIICMVLILLSFIGFFLLILASLNYVLPATLTSLMNLVVVLLLTMATFLARYIRPKMIMPPRKYLRKAIEYARNTTSLAMARLHNKDHYSNMQAVFIKAANEMIHVYRWALKANCSEGQCVIPDSYDMPEFNQIDLIIPDEDNMTIHIKNMIEKKNEKGEAI